MIRSFQGAPILLLGLWLLLGTCHTAHAQSMDEPLFAQELFDMADSLLGSSTPIDAYEALNRTLGGDSLRICDGQPCNGYVEDHYADGVLKHRGIIRMGNYWCTRTIGRLQYWSANTKW